MTQKTLTNPSSTVTPPDPSAMSIWEHLDELRSRLLKAIFSLVVAFFITLYFTSDIIDFLTEPYTRVGESQRLLQIEPTGNVVIYFRVALTSAAILAIPIITYQLFMFIAPGLTPKEKGWILKAIPFTTGFFFTGVAFAWFIMIPAAFEFLAQFKDDVFNNSWSAQRYFAFLTNILFWMGVAFEMPVVMYVLGRLGIVGSAILIRSWRFAIVVIAIISAVITPTVDPFNMLLVMAPLLVLYVISIVLVASAERRIKLGLEKEQT